MAGHKVLAVPASLMVEFWKGGARHNYQIVGHGLPHDAKIQGAAYNEKTGDVELIIYSMSYDFVKKGQRLPYVTYVPVAENKEKY